jgi:hypothetical protein
MHPVLAASVSGLAATLPMTVAMEAIFRRLPLLQRYPLPPRPIAMRVAEALDLKQELDEPRRLAFTLLSHFGYGTAAGGAYGLLARRWLPGARGGAMFGLGVWAGSYLGLLPGAGLYPPATQTPLRRNALMITAHLVWGAALGALTQSLAGRHAHTSTAASSVGQRQRL